MSRASAGDVDHSTLAPVDCIRGARKHANRHSFGNIVTGGACRMQDCYTKTPHSSGVSFIYAPQTVFCCIDTGASCGEVPRYDGWVVFACRSRWRFSVSSDAKMFLRCRFGIRSPLDDGPMSSWLKLGGIAASEVRWEGSCQAHRRFDGPKPRQVWGTMIP